MNGTAPAASLPLRAALSAPAVATLLVLQALRLLSPSPLVSLLLAEAVFVGAALLIARRQPAMSWAFVPVMWIGVALGAVADALWLGGTLAGLPALLGFAAPALAVGFALARSWPGRAAGQ